MGVRCWASLQRHQIFLSWSILPHLSNHFNWLKQTTHKSMVPSRRCCRRSPCSLLLAVLHCSCSNPLWTFYGVTHYSQHGRCLSLSFTGISFSARTCLLNQEILLPCSCHPLCRRSILDSHHLQPQTCSSWYPNLQANDGENNLKINISIISMHHTLPANDFCIENGDYQL